MSRQRLDRRRNFNPRSPCGERPGRSVCSGGGLDFNPRSPCGERLLLLGGVFLCSMRFQSTLPVWGATPGTRPPGICRNISIHAPRVGSDDTPDLPGDLPSAISIHAPRVGSDAALHNGHPALTISIHAPRVGSDGCLLSEPVLFLLFQSTLPVWGATAQGNYLDGPLYEFQSTLPVWGATVFPPLPSSTPSNFNPRSPCGERPDRL